MFLKNKAEIQPAANWTLKPKLSNGKQSKVFLFLTSVLGVWVCHNASGICAILRKAKWSVVSTNSHTKLPCTAENNHTQQTDKPDCHFYNSYIFTETQTAFKWMLCFITIATKTLCPCSLSRSSQKKVYYEVNLESGIRNILSTILELSILFDVTD